MKSLLTTYVLTISRSGAQYLMLPRAHVHQSRLFLPWKALPVG